MRYSTRRGRSTWHTSRRHWRCGRYCEASARYVFGDIVGDPYADSILRALRSAGTAGLSRSDLSSLFGRHLAANKIDAALIMLLSAGKVRRESIKKSAAGRPREMWFATAK